MLRGANRIERLRRYLDMAPGVQLIPSPEDVMQILKRTAAFREGHFIYPNGKHTAHYFQMPLAFRYYDTARGHAIEETVELVRSLGAPIIGCGAIVRFDSAPDHIGDVQIKSLVEFDEKFYDSGTDCVECKQGAPEEHVRF